jgi:hypothetical protein
VTIVVIDRLGAIANAHYYLPAQIANGVAASMWSIDRSFLVEASAERHELRRPAKSALRAGILILGTGVLLGELFAPEILRIFGASYEADGTTLLRLLLLSSPGTAVATFYSSFAWIDRRVWILTVRELFATAVLLVLIFVFIGHFGIRAIGIASIVRASGCLISSDSHQALSNDAADVFRYRGVVHVRIQVRWTRRARTFDCAGTQSVPSDRRVTRCASVRAGTSPIESLSSTL